MEELKIMKLIYEIESNYPVQNWKINNIDMWPVFRIITAFKLIKAKSNSQETFLELKEHPKKIPTLTSLLSNSDYADFLFFSDSQYRVNLDNIWYNRLSDPFYEFVINKGYKAINIDFSYQNAGKYPTLDDTYAIQNQLIFERKNIFAKELEIELPQFEDVRKRLIEITKSDSILTKESLINIAREMIYWISIFREILINKKIKYVFIVNYYQVISHSLIYACREFNIPTVDIQHGNQRDLFYHNWVKAPFCGYNTLPNYFWVWTEEHAEPIRKWNLNTEQHHVIVGGNPWLEMWKQDSNKIVQTYNSIIKNIVSNQQINILITLQPKYGLPNWEKNISESLLKVIKDSPDNYKFFVRYHQQMLHKYTDEKNNCEKMLAEFIQSGKVETKFATDLPLPALLKKMDLHITPFSTCVFEAKEFNVPSITLHPRAKLFFHNEIQNGWVIEARTSEEINKAINVQLQFKKSLRINNEQKNNLFERAINKIVSDSKNINNYPLNNKNKEILFGIYFMDKEFKKILENYEVTDSYKIDLFMVYLYREMEDSDKELKYSISAINKAIHSKVCIDDVDLVCNVLTKIINEKISRTFDEHFICWLNEYEELLGKVLWKLFSIQKYDEILWVCNRLTSHTLDSLFYMGRVHIIKKNPKAAIENLTKYINSYKSAKNCNISNSKNFLISAYYYLGKNFFELGNKESALNYLIKCIEFSEDQHIKANELIKKIKSKKM